MSKWRRVMAVGCTHGELIDPGARDQALAFRRQFDPEIRFDLGDLIDTACFRSGANGTKDEARRPDDDHAAAIRWIEEYEPTHIAWGNHDWRLYDLKDHWKATVASLAGKLWYELTDAAARVGAETVEYDIERGWFHLGGYAWGHGYMYNENAVRDHAEMLGCPVVMAHKHAPQQVEGRTVKATPSFCVGALADDYKLKYGRRRRASLTHGPGIVWGEVSDTEAHLWLIHSRSGQPLPIPPGLGLSTPSEPNTGLGCRVRPNPSPSLSMQRDTDAPREQQENTWLL